MITEERQKELSEMSDARLREMLGIRTKEVEELKRELNRRFPPRPAKRLIELPCTLAELETAAHGYGDHNGFHGKVDVVLDSLVDPVTKDYLAVTEGGAE